jgi:hypothetical protein
MIGARDCFTGHPMTHAAGLMFAMSLLPECCRPLCQALRSRGMERRA